MDGENENQSGNSGAFMLVAALVILIVSGSINLLLFKQYRDLNGMSTQVAPQADQAQKANDTIMAMWNDLNGYAQNKPELQEILKRFNVQ